MKLQSGICEMKNEYIDCRETLTNTPKQEVTKNTFNNKFEENLKALKDEEEDSSNNLKEITKFFTSNRSVKKKGKTLENELTLIKASQYNKLDNMNNSMFVDDIVLFESPSTSSMDSAKGSSIINDDNSLHYSTGDLFWAQIFNYCYWPCIVCPDPKNKTILSEEVKRSGQMFLLVHVRFFADNGRRNWVKCDNLLPFTSLENYQKLLEEAKIKYGIRNNKYKVLVPSKSAQAAWYQAVSEARLLSELPYGDRLKTFLQLCHKSIDSQRIVKQDRMQRRQSTISSNNSIFDVGNFTQNANSDDLVKKSDEVTYIDLKRDRSLSSSSSIHSPIKINPAKRHKFDSNHSKQIHNKLVNTNKELTMKGSICKSLNIYKNSAFRKFYMVMRNFILDKNENEYIEESFQGALRNIWALKYLCYNQDQEHKQLLKSENDNQHIAGTVNKYDEQSLVQFSNRLTSIRLNRNIKKNTYNTNCAISQNPIKREVGTKNLPPSIEEVVNNIFQLDIKYLFKGMSRYPVCKYCYKPDGNLQKCAKGCSNWLHAICLESASNHNNQLSYDNPDDFQIKTADTIEISIVCKECSNITGKDVYIECLVCRQSESLSSDDPLVLCTMAHCKVAMHKTCCKYWLQTKFNTSKNVIESFRCPTHVCHTCVSSDPRNKFQYLGHNKSVRCVKCPATYHMDSTCIPAGSQILTASRIICPRHEISTSDLTINVNWCFICVKGGELLCCDTCPTAVHIQCLKTPLELNEVYICDDCESGRMPLYGEIVWTKYNNFRWWPALILPPPQVPQNIANLAHNTNDFVVRFFGSHNHGWISKRRVYLYVEGDCYFPPRIRTTLDVIYNRGIEEAKHTYELITSRKKQLFLNGNSKNKLEPQPYTRIKTNRAVLPVRLHINMDSVNQCECNPKDENPCGPFSNCLNRVLYHECNPKVCPAGERCQNQMFESRISPRLEVVYMKERGFGLVSREPIEAGSFVIEYVGEVINDKEFRDRLAEKVRVRDENFYFLLVEKDYIIDAGPKGNLARFINHSCDPNCESQKWLVNSLNRVGIFSIKDIPVDTELTFNYHWDDILGNKKKACFCGATQCTGQIGGKNRELENKKTKKKKPVKLIQTKRNKTSLQSLVTSTKLGQIDEEKCIVTPSISETALIKTTVKGRKSRKKV